MMMVVLNNILTKLMVKCDGIKNIDEPIVTNVIKNSVGIKHVYHCNKPTFFWVPYVEQPQQKAFMAITVVELMMVSDGGLP